MAAPDPTPPPAQPDPNEPESTPSEPARGDSRSSPDSSDPDRPGDPEALARADAEEARQRRDPGSIEALRARTSVGRMSEEHWTKAREGLNDDALDYYRQRNEAPGVAEADQNARNSYCMECDGVLPLHYDSRQPAGRQQVVCPHCGAKQEANIKRMFNWVEMDQVPDSDLRALLPLFLLAGAVLAGLVWLLL